MKYKVVIADSVAQDQDVERQILQQIADVVVAPAGDPDALRELVRDADGVLTCYTKISEDIIQAMEKCQIIARSGIGVDTIPIPLATAKGIKVTNVADYCIAEVADHTMALMLALVRGLDPAMRRVRAGTWSVESAGPLRRLTGRKLGLVGFGNIAQAVARRAQAFGLNLLVADPFVKEDVLNEFGAKRVELDTLLKEADIVSLHAPLHAQTHHLINSSTLSLMQPHALLVNTSRGALVDFDALQKALVDGRIAGAGLDVLEDEPPEQVAAIAETPNLLLTPHIAFYSDEATQELREKSASEILRVLRGEEPLFQVNR